MTSLEPNVSPTGRYNINEAISILDIDRKTLYNYTKSGKIKCGFRRCNGRKFYMGSEIMRLWKAIE